MKLGKTEINIYSVLAVILSLVLGFYAGRYYEKKVMFKNRPGDNFGNVRMNRTRSGQGFIPSGSFPAIPSQSAPNIQK